MTNFKRILSLVLCIVLIAATALFTIGCSDNKNDGEENLNSQVEVKELGEGETKFDFVVKDIDGNKTKFLIKTDEETVGGALIKLGLIEGDESEFGLYVKKVNGIVADYDKDKTYWAFYVDGEYSMVGAESVKIEEGKVYSFEVSK